MAKLTQDEVRAFILEKSGETNDSKGKLAAWSRGIGKSHSYLHQFIHRGSPRKLHEDDRNALADLMGVPPERLKAVDPGKALAPPAPEPKLDGPTNKPVFFFVKEWRKFCEVRPSDLAKALGVDTDDYSLLENKPYRFSIEQLISIANALKIQFDSMRWNPENQPPVPQPARTDIARINKAMGRK